MTMPLFPLPATAAPVMVPAMAAVAGMLLVFLAGLVTDFRRHVRVWRPEILADAAVVSVLAGAGAYVLLRNDPRPFAGPGGVAVVAGLAGLSAVVAAGFAVFALWWPTRLRIGLFGCAMALAGSAAALDALWNASMPGDATVALLAVAAFAALAGAAMIRSPKFPLTEARLSEPPWWVRPAVLAFSFAAMATLFVVTMLRTGSEAQVGQVVAIGITVLGAVGARTMMMQVSALRAISDREAALADREAAIASLQAAVGVVAASEGRLRLLLDSAVDGIVELDGADIIVSANGAFCAMVRQQLVDVRGRPWREVVGQIGPGGTSLAGLPETGEATLVTDAGTTYLEARSSQLPTIPPGSLLLIRDVTASRVADQTIRSLFQFLQDRDEDRTRLLKRTNAAIESERNRIARDLHDGPIQGISAAGLSLEAIRLMLDSGDLEGGARMLQVVCAELSEEAMNLRRIMKDLRPPILEERGLAPAVRELCARVQREMSIPVRVSAGPIISIPTDVETLAYRIVQEALSNVAKHAEASSIVVRIEASSGTLEVEVTDDGRGFDPAQIREFLAGGRVGLASMRERSELAGGTLSVRSGFRAGTTVRATLPFEVLAAASA
jgi:signal transduction histidine kinase